MKTSSIALLLAICASPCAAQVFVVDVNNGPGAHFTSISAAVAAVPNGAVLLVRAGVYGAFAIRGKSLSVLGEPGVVVLGVLQVPIEVSGLAAGQSVTLRRLSWSNPLGPGELLCQSCAGTVLLDECRADRTVTSTGGNVRAVACDRLLLRETRLQPVGAGVAALQVERSNAVLTSCTLEGVGYTLSQIGGRVQVSASSIVGATFGQPVSAVSGGGRLVIHGSSRFDAGPLGSGAGLAIDGTGWVDLDPSTTFLNVRSPPLGVGLTVSNRAIPSLYAATASLGSFAAALLAVPAGGVGVLLIGVVTTPYPVPGLADPSWLARGAWTHASGGAPATVGGYFVPNAIALLGVQVGWQGLVLDGNGTLGVSNPVAYVHY